MAKYQRILVPTDGSTEAERVLDHAVDLAMTHDASLHAVYVMNTTSFTGLPMETAWEGIDDVLRQEGSAALETVRESAERSGIEIDCSLLEGSPAREIVRYADEQDCDLVVMGTHGRGGINRLLLGSVAEQVVRTSPVPVLTVRVGEEESTST
jgi:nucleotide-binding universal stress UspA family protein